MESYEESVVQFISAAVNLISLCIPLFIYLFIIYLFSILKNLVGKDVTKTALPVHLNEPLCFTQVSASGRLAVRCSRVSC